MNRRRVIAVIMLLVFGAARLPFEQKLAADLRAAHFHGARLDLGMREQIGQMAFLAALSGFRALVADALFLHAYTAWENVEWGRMKLDYDAVTSLQPRCELFWQTAAWQMAYNASAAAINDQKQPREALRLKAQQEYFKLGEEYLLRGIANNPEKPPLYNDLGMLYRDKLKDYCKASEIYRQYAKLPGSLAYGERLSVYSLASCPGHEREAYEKLVELYKRGENEHLPTLLRLILTLQEKLNIPADKRVNIPEKETKDIPGFNRTDIPSHKP
jgi:hypothetical protein